MRTSTVPARRGRQQFADPAAGSKPDPRAQPSRAAADGPRASSGRREGARPAGRGPAPANGTWARRAGVPGPAQACGGGREGRSPSPRRSGFGLPASSPSWRRCCALPVRFILPRALRRC